MVPSVEKFRMLGSGTEACMCAARIARLKTGKKNILKMGGAYHGWSDQLAYGMRVPGTKGMMSKGVPNFVFKHTDEFFPNDLNDLDEASREAIELCFEDEALHEIARLAKEQNTGARGLRAIMEGFLQKIMYELPDRRDVEKVVIGKDTVTNSAPPTLCRRKKQEEN